MAPEDVADPILCTRHAMQTLLQIDCLTFAKAHIAKAVSLADIDVNWQTKELYIIEIDVFLVGEAPDSAWPWSAIFQKGVETSRRKVHRAKPPGPEHGVAMGELGAT